MAIADYEDIIWVNIEEDTAEKNQAFAFDFLVFRSLWFFI